MPNRVAPGHWDPDLSVNWLTVRDNIPSLERALRTVLESEPS